MRQKFFILFLTFILVILPAACFADNNSIDAMELAKYGQTYTYESLSERLSRLENDLFGMSQSGDLDSRLQKLSQVIQPVNINPNNIVYPETAYNYDVKPKRNVFKKFWDNVSDTFGTNGIVTGYTPAMYSSSYSSDLYRNELRNMFYNPPNYCPYTNTFNNRYNKNFPPINNRILQNQRLHPYYNAYNNNYYNYPGYRNYNRIYYPPNIVTSSSVHILDN